MTKRSFYLLFMIGVTLAFMACSKSDNGTPNVMTAVTGDSTFNANVISAGPVNGKFVITGTVSQNGIYGQSISIVLDNYNYTTDTLRIDGSSVQATYTTNIANKANNGQISIIAATAHSAQGNFYFSCSNGVSVTAGYFNVSW